MVRDGLTIEQSQERNHAELRGRVFWVETVANVKAWRARSQLVYLRTSEEVSVAGTELGCRNQGQRDYLFYH